MQIDFKKFLPSNMRSTRWGELFEALQDYLLNGLKSEKIDIIKNQYILDELMYDDYFNLCQLHGYTLFSYDGYGESTKYLKRQVEVLTHRILNKTCRKGYKSIFYIYDLIGEIYPLYENELDGYLLYPITDFWSNNEVAGSDLYLDSSPDIYLDTDSFPNLDLDNSIDSITRHMVISYKPKYVETADEFLSNNTAFLLERDIKIHKRKTEIPYFEPYLDIYVTSGVGQHWYYDHDEINSGVVQSYLYDDLSGVAFIHFGSGIASGVIDGYIPSSGITDVEILSNEFVTSGITWDIFTNTSLQGRKKISQKQKINSFKELALLNSSSGIILYSTFPEIIYTDTMYGNFYLNINVV